jgi:hypothetical protein
MCCVEYHDEVVVGYCCSINIEAVVLLGTESIAEVRCATMGGVSVDITPCGPIPYIYQIVSLYSTIVEGHLWYMAV